MRRRHADPAELVRTSKLVRAWQRRMADKAAGDDLADERWYAYLLTMARPVPPPSCAYCDDTGIDSRTCTIRNRCRSWVCATPDRRSDADWEHAYARACTCPVGRALEPMFATANAPQYAAKPAAGKKATYGFTKATGGR